MKTMKAGGPSAGIDGAFQLIITGIAVFSLRIGAFFPSYASF